MLKWFYKTSRKGPPGRGGASARLCRTERASGRGKHGRHEQGTDRRVSSAGSYSLPGPVLHFTPELGTSDSKPHLTQMRGSGVQECLSWALLAQGNSRGSATAIGRLDRLEDQLASDPLPRWLCLSSSSRGSPLGCLSVLRHSSCFPPTD